jgi:hypothetical protein
MPFITPFPHLPWTAFAIVSQAAPFAAGVNVYNQHMPACIISGVRASLVVASGVGVPQFDINSGGVSILSTKLTVDATETTSVTAATPAVIIPASRFQTTDDWILSIDIDAIGNGAAVGAVILMLLQWL